MMQKVMRPKLIKSLLITGAAWLLSACATVPADREVSYAEYRKITCATVVDGYCVEKGVGLDAERIRSLIFHASLRMRENYPSKGVRLNEALSDIYKTTVVEIIAGSYRMTGRQPLDAAEEVSLFRLKDGEWVHLDTSVSLRCSG